MSKKPDCYKPHNDPYPLCRGKGDDKEVTAMENCKDCNLYEDMEETWDPQQ